MSKVSYKINKRAKKLINFAIKLHISVNVALCTSTANVLLALASFIRINWLKINV